MDDEILANPITGESIRILESTAQTFKARYSLRPHAEIPGEHLHPAKEQRVTVLSGEMHLRVSGRHCVVRAGETMTIPAGARHFQWNPCDTEAVVVEEIRPAGRIHEFFKILFRLARDGKTDSAGHPSLLTSAALFSEFKDSIRPASFALRTLTVLLGPIAGVLGYRRQIREYLRHTGPWLP